MNCTECRENFTALGKGQLPAPEVAVLQQHLDACGACRAELLQWQSLYALLDQSEPVPAGMVERISAALAHSTQSTEQSPAASARVLFMQPSLQSSMQRFMQLPGQLFLRLWPSRPVWAFCYSLVLLGSGVVGGQLLPAGLSGTESATSQTTTPDSADSGKTALVCPVHSSPAFWLPGYNTTTIT